MPHFDNKRDTAYHLLAEVFTHPAILWFQSRIKIGELTLDGKFIGHMSLTPEHACQMGYDSVVLKWAKKLNENRKFSDANLNC